MGEAKRVKVSASAISRGERVTVELKVDVRAEVRGDNIFYLGKTSIEKEDFLHFLKLEDAKVTGIDKKDLIKNTDLIEQVIESINSQINAGKLDKEIKDKYKKSGKVDITQANIKAGNHRASPNNKGHNWIPEKPPENGTDTPQFWATNPFTKERTGPFKNIATACATVGDLNAGNVRHCLLGNRSTCEGYTFEFSDPSSPEVVQWIAENKAKQAA